MRRSPSPKVRGVQRTSPSRRESSRPHSTVDKRPRGFVLIVVLAVLAFISTTIAMQTVAASTQTSSTSTTMRASSARAIAEICLEQALRATRKGLNDDLSTWDDFDAVLDPADDANINDADAFVPTFCTAIAHIPASAAGMTPEIQALHRYCAIPLLDGACFIRFDDNHDEQLPQLPTYTASTTAGEEAAGVDRPDRDRDRAIIVTAIGASPISAAAIAANPTTAFNLASSKTTFRGFLQIETEASTVAPALVLRGNLDHGGSGEISLCGAGRVQHIGNLTNGNGNKRCVCGVEDTGYDWDECKAGECGWFNATQPCAPKTANPSAPATFQEDKVAPFSFPSPTEVIVTAPVGFNNPYTSTVEWATGIPWQGMGIGGISGTEEMGTGACKFYFGTSTVTTNPIATAFFWDKTDFNPHANLTTPPVAWKIASYTPPATPPVGWTTQNCATYKRADSPNAVRKPCTWALDGAQNITVSCQGDETPCWKPVAFFTGSSANPFAGGQESTNDDGTTEYFRPKDDIFIPLSGNGGANVRYETACGKQTAFSIFPSTNDAINEGFGWNNTSKNWVVAVDNDLHYGHFPPNGYVMAFGDGPAGPSNVIQEKDLGDYAFGQAYPARLAMIGKNDMDFDEDFIVRCPTCDAGDITNSNNYDDVGFLATYKAMAKTYAVSARGNLNLTGSKDRIVIGHLAGTTVQIEGKTNRNYFAGDVHGGGPHFNYAGTAVKLCGFDGNINDSHCRNPGICLHEDINLAGTLRTTGSLTIGKDNNIGTRYGDPLNDPETMHSAMDICIDEDNNLTGTFYAYEATNITMQLDKKNRIRGRLLSNSDLIIKGNKNEIGWAGGGAAKIVVQENIVVQETNW